MSNKRQQTMAKIARERTVRERRELKLEKKQAAAAERKSREAAAALGLTVDPVTAEPGLEAEAAERQEFA